MKRGPEACGAWQLLVQFYYTQRAHLPSVSADLELSPAQCPLLHVIEPDRPLPMGKLAQTLACDASNITGLVDRLEDQGLVKRRASPSDRRVQYVALTAAGRKFFRTMARANADWVGEFFAELTGDDIDDLMRVLAKTKSSVRKTIGNGGAR